MSPMQGTFSLSFFSYPFPFLSPKNDLIYSSLLFFYIHSKSISVPVRFSKSCTFLARLSHKPNFSKFSKFSNGSTSSIRFPSSFNTLSLQSLLSADIFYIRFAYNMNSSRFVIFSKALMFLISLLVFHIANTFLFYPFSLFPLT